MHRREQRDWRRARTRATAQTATAAAAPASGAMSSGATDQARPESPKAWGLQSSRSTARPCCGSRQSFEAHRSTTWNSWLLGHCCPRLSLCYESVVHRGANQVETDRNERIEVVVERVAKRGSEQYGSARSRLMVVVDDVGEPRPIQHAVHRLRVGVRRRVRIGAVVGAHVLQI